MGQFLHQGLYRLVGLEVGVVLGNGDQAAQGLRQHAFLGQDVPGIPALPGGNGGGAGLDDALQRLFFEFHLAPDGLDEVRDKVVAPFELHVYLAERVGDLVAQLYKPVEREHYPTAQHKQNYG